MKTIQLETEGYQPPKSGLVLLQCLVGLLFFTFVIRFWYLQIHRGADFAQQAQANHLRQESVYASRGLIRDVKGTLLAENRPAFGLALIREDCKDISATLAQVSEWAGIPLEQLTNRFQQDRRKVKPFEPILLLNDMPFDQVARIEAQLMHWPGLEIVTRSKRYYPEGKEFAHILGYVAEANEQELAADPYLALGDTVGKQGLEYVFEQRLRGHKGLYNVEVDVLGRSLGKTLVEEPQNGENLQLCLDTKLQKQLAPIYDDLTNLCSHFHAVLDYPDEDIEDFGLEQYSKSLRGDAKALYALLQTYGQGRILRQGVAAAIVGKPNVGKSSLLNALAGFDRCIVTDVPGTTRDTVEETVLLGSTRLRLIDTAGIRETADTVEAMGVRRSREAVENADLVIFVCDGSQPLDGEDQAIIDLCMEQENAVALINKTDLGSAVEPGELPFLNVIPICVKTGEGLDQLADAVDAMFENETPCDGSILTNARQFDAIRRAYEAMLRSLQGLQLGITPDAVLTDVEQAMEAMGEITGATVREDITARIFERFCVGK